MRALVAAFTLAALAAWPASAVAAPASDCAYSYFDDFSTNAVENDSYSHSRIVDQFTTLSSAGWLMFVTDSTGNRGLGLYAGYMYPMWPAHVAYRLPVDGGAGEAAGTLGFDLLPTLTGAGAWGLLCSDLEIRYDDSLAVSARLCAAGHYSFALAPPPTVADVYLRVVGKMCRLDNLFVCLESTVPARSTTWGRIKSIYR